MVKIYDCFMFMNEFDMLKKRLDYLKNTVDCFVLVESPYLHSGKPKELLFTQRKEEFKGYNIIHLVSDELPADFVGFSKQYGFDTLNWDREMYQREYLKNVSDVINDDDIVLISDVDEIPDIAAVRPHTSTVGLHMLNFQFNFNFVQHREPWVGTVITNGSHFKTHGANFFRYNRWRFTILRDSGWHLSSFGDIEHILYKFNNFSHCDDVAVKDVITADYLTAIIVDGDATNLAKDIRPSKPDEIATVPQVFL